MPKNTLFSMKCKHRPAMGVLTSDPYASGGRMIRPQALALVLPRYGFLAF